MFKIEPKKKERKTVERGRKVELGACLDVWMDEQGKMVLETSEVPLHGSKILIFLISNICTC
jgi:hypothetical protein